MWVVDCADLPVFLPVCLALAYFFLLALPFFACLLCWGLLSFLLDLVFAPSLKLMWRFCPHAFSALPSFPLHRASVFTYLELLGDSRLSVLWLCRLPGSLFASQLLRSPPLHFRILKTALPASASSSEQPVEKPVEVSVSYGFVIGSKPPTSCMTFQVCVC